MLFAGFRSLRTGVSASRESEREGGLNVAEVGVVIRASVLEVTAGEEVAVANEEAELLGRLPRGGEVDLLAGKTVRADGSHVFAGLAGRLCPQRAVRV